MKLNPNQLVLWWSNSVGWKLFRVVDVRPDKVYLINRHGTTKNFDPAKYGHRIRRFGLKMLLPWLHPPVTARTVGGAPLRWNAPRRPG